MAKLLINKEQFKTLNPFLPHFLTAKVDYVRGLYSRDVESLRKVYSEIGYHLDSASCPSCVLTMVKLLGEQYFLYKERYYRNGKEQQEKE